MTYEPNVRVIAVHKENFFGGVIGRFISQDEKEIVVKTEDRVINLPKTEYNIRIEQDFSKEIELVKFAKAGSRIWKTQEEVDNLPNGTTGYFSNTTSVSVTKSFGEWAGQGSENPELPFTEWPNPSQAKELAEIAEYLLKGKGVNLENY